jgi:hypothetical protein
MKRRRGATVGSVRHTPIPVSHSSVQLFELPRVLTTFDRGYTEDIFSKTNLIGPQLEERLSGERNVYVDMRNMYLSLQISVLAYDHAGDKTFKEITNPVDDPAVLVNNALHSIFSNCEVSLQGEVIGTSNNLYGHKAFIETELSHPTECKDTWLKCQGYDYEKDPGASTDPALASRRFKNVAKTWNNFYGRLAVDFFGVDFF